MQTIAEFVRHRTITIDAMGQCESASLVDSNFQPARSITDLRGAVIAIDLEGTVLAMNSSAAWLLRCELAHYVGAHIAQILPALNRGLAALSIRERRGIALRADGKVIRVRTTGFSYRSALRSGWMILVERSSAQEPARAATQHAALRGRARPARD